METKSLIVKRKMNVVRRNDAQPERFSLTPKFLLCFIAIILCSTSFAQYNNPQTPTYRQGDDNPSHSFKKENIFVGGALQLGYYGNTFSVGGNPEIGYSIAQWLDAGVAFNLNYSADRADPTLYYNNDVRTRTFNYGGGVFVRAYPVRFIFLELQPEENWIHQSQKDYYNNLEGSITVHSTSLIGGIGYTQRIVGEGSFFTLIGLDLLNNIYSPYRDSYGAAIPVIRVGFDVYLHPAKRPARDRSQQ